MGRAPTERRGAFPFSPRVTKLGNGLISEVLQRIYQSEIPGRIEWMFDEGFVWVLVGPNGEEHARNLPRLWVDNALAGERTTARSDLAREAVEPSQFIMRDWRARGCERTIDSAVYALADAIVRLHASSEFAQWWRAIRIAHQPGRTSRD
jgi:hypothetical protein